MGALGKLFGLFGTCCAVLVAVLAIFLGWAFSQHNAEGRIFATIIPLVSGYPPPTIFGAYHTPLTIEVPADLKPQPRPAKETFLSLPGGGRMPANGLGLCCRASAYDFETVRRSVLWYLLIGGRHLDTADLYLNHRAVGAGIADATARGVPRSEIFLTTKVTPGDMNGKVVEQAVPRYLEELGVDYIDLVLIHMPSNPFKRKGACEGTWPECRAEVWRTLSKLKGQGIVRNIGVSNFGAGQMAEISALGAEPIAVNQFHYNPWTPDHSEETFKYCHAHKIAVTAWASFQGTMMQTAAALTVETLQEISKAKKVTPAQLLLGWALQKNASVIPGTGNPIHMRENLAVYDIKLSSEDMSRIDALRSDPVAKKMMAGPPDTT